jgi:hypothetical protein
MKVTLNLFSSNRKTGPIPVSTTHKDSCPNTCPLKASGCYAEYGPLAIYWRRVEQAGMAWEAFCDKVSNAIPMNTLWRHNQAGDLPYENGVINQDKVKRLIIANMGKRGFTYTHHDASIPENQEIIRNANNNKFTINLSANSLAHADELSDIGIAPIVVIVNDHKNTLTPAGRKVIVCPATTSDYVNCMSCGLCAKSNRKSIIGFPVHGNGKKSVINKLNV